MKREIESIYDNDTWEIVDKPEETNILDTKWVYNLKSHEVNERDKYKAGLVVRGFAQEHMFDYDMLHSPVASLSTIRTLLSI